MTLQPRSRMVAACLVLAIAFASTVATAHHAALHAHRAPARRAAASKGVTDSTGAVIYSEPQLYMAWHAPWGEPHATDNLSVPVNDTSRVDTLYLSFETGRDAPKFYGMYARLYFRPQFGDTLGRYFNFKRGWWNQGNMRIEFDPDGTFPCPQPWTRAGFGQPDFEMEDGSHAARLDLIYGMREQDVGPVNARTRYCFARLMFRQKRTNLEGAHAPACLEWAQARLSFGGRDIVAEHGPGRFVSFNSPDGSVCTPYRRAAPTTSWHPKGTTNPNQQPAHTPDSP